jgi:hypothetical protein
MPHPSNFHQCLGTASSDRSLSQTLREEPRREARRLRCIAVAIDAWRVDAQARRYGAPSFRAVHEKDVTPDIAGKDRQLGMPDMPA